MCHILGWSVFSVHTTQNVHTPSEQCGVLEKPHRQRTNLILMSLGEWPTSQASKQQVSTKAIFGWWGITLLVHQESAGLKGPLLLYIVISGTTTLVIITFFSTFKMLIIIKAMTLQALLPLKIS